VVLGFSQDGACTDLLENLSMNSLMGDLSNALTFNPPLFSLVKGTKLTYCSTTIQSRMTGCEGKRSRKYKNTSAHKSSFKLKYTIEIKSSLIKKLEILQAQYRCD
jgi:hypothetical protein